MKILFKEKNVKNIDTITHKWYSVGIVNESNIVITNLNKGVLDFISGALFYLKTKGFPNNYY